MRATKLHALPRVILWAWERPEDLRSAEPATAGVAFLAQTIFISETREGDGISVRPRLQPVRFSAEAPLIAVTRIEARGVQFGDAAQRAQRASLVAKLIARTGDAPDVLAVQVDFDAAESQRDFYRDLLIDLRHELRADLPISITALASWCEGDEWLDQLPIDEAVPMLFRMGTDGNSFRGKIVDGGEFRSSACRSSVGVSTDEPILGGKPLETRMERIYVFNPRPWNAAAFARAFSGELR